MIKKFIFYIKYIFHRNKEYNDFYGFLDDSDFK